MAKSQKRSGREAKKPKSTKTVAAAAATSVVSRGMQSLVTPKKKA